MSFVRNKFVANNNYNNSNDDYGITNDNIITITNKVVNKANLDSHLARSMNSGQQNNQQKQQQGQGGQGLPNISNNNIGFDATSNNANISNGAISGFGINNNGFSMQPNFSAAAGAPMNDAFSSGVRAHASTIGNADLQQALLQSMASSSSATAQAHQSPLFAGSRGGVTDLATSASGLSPAQMSLVQQMLGKMSSGGATGPGTASSPLQQMGRQQQQQSLLQQGLNQGQGQLQGQLAQRSHQGQRQQQSPLLQQQRQHQVQPNSNQESMISQLIATLQAQQQSQQQAQVQAAIARAFGSNGGGNPSSSGPGGADGSSGPGIVNYLQGFSGSGVSGLPGTSAAVPSTQDLLSRMQLAQAAASNSMSGSTGTGTVGVNSSNLGRNANTPGSICNNNGSRRTSASSVPTAPVDVTKAGAEEIIKLHMEQQRHNIMIQMAQADRQERAVLANHEAMLKKQRKLLQGSSSGNSGSSLGGAEVENPNFTSLNNNSKMNNLFSAAATATLQHPIHSNLSPSFASKMPSILNSNPNLNPSALETNVTPKLGASQGAVIVPCRARGMPVDHNFKTAYFIIPEGIEHGDELMCSYPACRQAGVKFRYCLHCKVPVAKRNFRNRHRHGVSGADGESISDDDNEENLSSDDEDDNNDNSAAKVPKASDNSTAAAANAAPFCRPINQEHSSSGGNSVKQEHIIVIPADNGKMKKKKKSGNARVPCRARGMPMAHNFKTAYFNIPPNIQHGDELLCSFPACRSAGAKFRYCLHCKVPVAKRNFRNRHKHGNIGEKKKSSPNNLEESPQENHEEEEEQTDNLEGSEVKKEIENQYSDEDDGDLKPSSSPSTERLELSRSSLPLSNQDQEDEKPTASPANHIGRSEGTNSAEAVATVSIQSAHDPDKVQAWVSLLESKPDPSDKHAMAIWMMNLMSATELTGGPAPAVQSTPPAPAAASAPATTQSSQQSPLKRTSSKESEVSEDRRPPKKKFKKEWEEL